MQHDPNARTQITEVDLPSELTTPLPEDAGPLVVAARTAAETALGVPGVHHLGGLVARAADRVRSQLGRTAGAPGVQVDDNDGTLDVTVSVVVSYPHPVREVAEEVRRQVAAAVSQLGAGQPTTVDVRVLDVHGPFDDEPTPVDKAREAVGDAVDRTKEAVSGAAESVRDGAAEVAERARDAAQDAAEATRDAAGRARDAAGDAVDEAREAQPSSVTGPPTPSTPRARRRPVPSPPHARPRPTRRARRGEVLGRRRRREGGGQRREGRSAGRLAGDP